MPIELYGVTTARLNEQVRRNAERFPEDFMFQLTNRLTAFEFNLNEARFRREEQLCFRLLDTFIEREKLKQRVNAQGA